MLKNYKPDEDVNLFDKLLDQFCLLTRQLSSRSKKLCEQLSFLAKERENGVSGSTRKEIKKCLLEEDVCSDEWFQTGKHLLLKARREKSEYSKKTRIKYKRRRKS